MWSKKYANSMQIVPKIGVHQGKQTGWDGGHHFTNNGICHLRIVGATAKFLLISNEGTCVHTFAYLLNDETL